MEEDKYLYKKFLEGDNESFEKIILKYKSNIIYFITRYVKNIDIAEDIFQDIMIYIIENKERYNFNYSLKTYFYTIAKSKALDYIKHNKYIQNIDEKELYQEEQLLEEIILNKERQIKLQKIINKMSMDYQMVLYLTQIDGLSYRDTAIIMEKSERQIKTLVYNAKKKLKQLLIKEKVIKIENNHIVKLLLIIVAIIIMSSGIVYAGIKIYETVVGNANLTPVFTGKIGDTDINNIWGGNFQIAWNEFENNIVKQNIKFEGDTPNIINELNKKVFTSDMLTKDKYYIKVGPTSPKLKDEIMNEIHQKFNRDVNLEINQINFDIPKNCYTIFSMLFDNFEFITPLDKLKNDSFNNSQEMVEYFGINNASNESLNDNIKVLFYNNETDFGIKILTQSNDEVILYRTDSKDTFQDTYNQILEKTNKYNGDKKFLNNDILKIPYINIDTLINYDDLCGRLILGKNKIYITNALQNIKFSLNEKGGNIESNSLIKNESLLETSKGRNFDYSNKFVILIKEENKELPYFALRVDNTDILKKVEN